jgi:hypothetical protein
MHINKASEREKSLCDFEEMEQTKDASNSR